MSNRATSVSSERASLPLVPDASNILLLVPSLTSSKSGICTDLLLKNHPGEVAVLRVEFTLSPNHLIEDWSSDIETAPSECKIITVGHRTGAFQERQLPFDVTLGCIGKAGNLTNIGVEIIKTLKEWERNSGQIVFCLHSLTPLFHYAEFDRAYRFLHVLTRHMSDQDVVAHYHMDPNAHEASTIHTLKMLFDAILETDDGGDTKIITR